MMKNTKIILSILVAIVLFIIIYLWAFVYSFRNFGEIANWKPIKTYEFPLPKETVEQAIHEVVNENAQTMTLIDSNYAYSRGDQITTSIVWGSDTIEYDYRFYGDDSMWRANSNSIILLMGIISKGTAISPATIKNKKTNKEQIQTQLKLFESALIDPVRKKLKISR
jgi:hypothetical protein